MEVILFWSYGIVILTLVSRKNRMRRVQYLYIQQLWFLRLQQELTMFIKYRRKWNEITKKKDIKDKYGNSEKHWSYFGNNGWLRIFLYKSGQVACRRVP